MSKPRKAILSNEVRDVVLVPLSAGSGERVAALSMSYYGDEDKDSAVMLTLFECAELAVLLLETYAYNKLGVDAVPHVRKLLSPLLEGE